MAGNFYKVMCSDYENEQVVFGEASPVVSCVVRGTTLAAPTSDNAGFHGEVVETVEHRGNGELEA